MKTIKMISKLALVAFMFVAVSCSSDSDGGGGATAAAGTIKAKVGGSSFTSMAAATVANRITSGGETIITLQGTNSNGKNITLVMTGVTATGTYDIGGDNMISIVGSYIDTDLQNPMSSPTYVAPTEGGAVAGSITVSELTDTKIVGTFHFTGTNQDDATDKKEVTNGAFNLEF